jgi:hypothetical protein
VTPLILDTPDLAWNFLHVDVTWSKRRIVLARSEAGARRRCQDQEHTVPWPKPSEWMESKSAVS